MLDLFYPRKHSSSSNNNNKHSLDIEKANNQANNLALVLRLSTYVGLSQIKPFVIDLSAPINK